MFLVTTTGSYRVTRNLRIQILTRFGVLVQLNVDIRDPARWLADSGQPPAPTPIHVFFTCGTRWVIQGATPPIPRLLSGTLALLSHQLTITRRSEVHSVSRLTHFHFIIGNTKC